jgi:hypothetical protein
MDIHPIRTPTDFGKTMSLSHSVEHWYAATPEWEPEIRQTLAQIFDDLPYISADEPGMVTVYLEGIEEPIRRLTELGLQIFAIPTTRTMGIGTADGPQRMEMTYTAFIAAPPTVVFRAGDGLAHLLAGGCPDAATEAVSDAPKRAWGSPAVIEQDLEGSVPWCPRCAMTAV